MSTRFDTPDEYIAAFPADIQAILTEVRESIRKALPHAAEAVRYQLPAVQLNGRAHLHFGAWKHHVGLYPIYPLDEPLEDEIAPYRSGKDSIRFPLKDPIPYALIERLAAALAEKANARAGPGETLDT